MKKLAILSLVLGLLSMGIGLYVYFVLVPAAYAAETAQTSAINASLNSDGTLSPELKNANLAFEEVNSKKFTFSYVALFGGLLALILGVVSGIKKEILGWVAVAFGLGAAIIGTLIGTHMFS